MLSFVHVFTVYTSPFASVCFNVKLPAVNSFVVMLSSADSDEFPALSVVFVFTLYVLFVVKLLNTFDVCHADQVLPVFNAYCVLAIPDKASVCLFVTVIEFVVTVTVGAVFVGAVLSIFIVYDFVELFKALSVVVTFAVYVPSSVKVLLPV